MGRSGYAAKENTFQFANNCETAECLVRRVLFDFLG